MYVYGVCVYLSLFPLLNINELLLYGEWFGVNTLFRGFLTVCYACRGSSGVKIENFCNF